MSKCVWGERERKIGSRTKEKGPAKKKIVERTRERENQREKPERGREKVACRLQDACCNLTQRERERVSECVKLTAEKSLIRDLRRERDLMTS